MGAMDDPIALAIAAVLERAPERWQALERDDLTALEDSALQTLIARGLIEVRVGGRLSVVGDARPIRFRIEFTGEGGLPQALAPVLRLVAEVSAAAAGHDLTAPSAAMTPDESGCVRQLGLADHLRERLFPDLGIGDGDQLSGMPTVASGQQTVAPRRGRPPAKVSAAVSSTTATATAPKRRGRPPGSKNKAKS